MAEQLQLRRDTTANIATSTGAEGELWMDTQQKRLVINDGTTVGGFPIANLSDVGDGAFTNQAANTIFAGPVSGPPAQPRFRLLVEADLPATPEFEITTNTTLTEPGFYYITANNITITLVSPIGFTQPIYLKEQTGSLSPNIIVNGNIDTNTGGTTITQPQECLKLKPSQLFLTWTQSS